MIKKYHEGSAESYVNTFLRSIRALFLYCENEEYISFKDMDTYGRFEWTGKSKLKKDYYPLFQSLEYENLLDNFLYLHLQQYEELEKAERIANQIIDLTKPYLQ